MAPFYYSWPILLKLPEAKKTLVTDWDIRKVLPGQGYTFKIQTEQQPMGLQIPHPLQGGDAVPFSNELDEKGWVSFHR